MSHTPSKVERRNHTRKMPNAHDLPDDARQPAQHSFLIRFWRTTPRGAWHATLQRATDEPAMHFAGIELLFAFLLVHLDEDAPPLNSEANRAWNDMSDNDSIDSTC